MNDYTPEQYALLEGTSKSGYALAETDDGWWIQIAATGERLRFRQNLWQAFADIDRYERLTAGLPAA